MMKMKKKMKVDSFRSNRKVKLKQMKKNNLIKNYKLNWIKKIKKISNQLI